MVSSIPAEASNSPHELRKRATKPVVKSTTKPRKSLSASFCSPGEESAEKIEELYRQANVKVSSYRPTALETIFESPKCLKRKSKEETKENERVLMGNVRLKRLVNFTPFYQPSKLQIKHRKNRIKAYKKAMNVGGKKCSAKVSLDLLKLTLDQISDDEESDVKSLSRSFRNVEDLNTSWCSRDNIIVHDESAQSNSNYASDALGLIEHMEGLNFDDNLLCEADKMEKMKEAIDSIDFDIDEELSKANNKNKKSRRSGRVSRATIDMFALENENDFCPNVRQNDDTNLSTFIKPLGISSNENNVEDKQLSDVAVSAIAGRDSSSVLEKIEQNTIICTELKNVVYTPNSKNISKRKSRIPKKRRESLLKSKSSKCSDGDYKVNVDINHVKIFTRNSRRNSGVTRKLYTSFFDSPQSPIYDVFNRESKSEIFDENKESPVKSPSVNEYRKSPDNASNSNNNLPVNLTIPDEIKEVNNISLSPSTLLSQLDINSPLSLNNLSTNKLVKTRRRSARLSHAGLGSNWQDKTPQKINEPSSSVNVTKTNRKEKIKRKSILSKAAFVTSSPVCPLPDVIQASVDLGDKETFGQVTSQYEPSIQERLQLSSDNNSFSRTKVDSFSGSINRNNLSKITNRRKSGVSKVKKQCDHLNELNDHSSPILTGYFDDKMRVFMGKKYKHKEDSRISLKEFKLAKDK